MPATVTAASLVRKIETSISKGVANADTMVDYLVDLYKLSPWITPGVDAALPPEKLSAKDRDVLVADYFANMGINAGNYTLPAVAGAKLLKIVFGEEWKADKIKVTNANAAALTGWSVRTVIDYKRDLGLARAENKTPDPRLTAGDGEDGDTGAGDGEGDGPATPKRPNIETLLNRLGEAAPFMTADDVAAALTILIGRQSELAADVAA